MEPFLIYFRLTSKNLHQARRILRTFLLLLLTGSLKPIFVESCHMLRQIGNCHCFTSTDPLSKMYQYVRGKSYQAGHFVEKLSHLPLISCRWGLCSVWEDMQFHVQPRVSKRQKPKPRRINIFLLVYDIPLCELLSQILYTPITNAHAYHRPVRATR